jgi:hypothetical protein
MYVPLTLRQKVAIPALLVAVVGGVLSCESAPTIQTVRSPSAEKIPLGVVIHPLFSTELSGVGSARTWALLNSNREHIYISPPAETSLKVTGPSQRLTSDLSMELAARGFKLSELPVETPEGQGDNKNAFAVSLALLDNLRASHNVRAILIGNAFFANAPYNNDTRVTDFYVKMVDVETLEVLCQISLSHDYEGRDMQDAARDIADQLAIEAGLPTSDE